MAHEHINLRIRVLNELFQLAERPCSSAADLAVALDASVEAVECALVALEERGLVDAGRLRLTMRGLSLACSLDRAGSPAAQNTRDETISNVVPLRPASPSPIDREDPERFERPAWRLLREA